MKRCPDDILSWDEYFMCIAILSSMRSKDPNTRVGACIVNCDNKIVGVGYNGFPRGCSDDEFPWTRCGVVNKYLYVVHAEANAILNSHGSLGGCRIYCNLFPCNECAKIIIQSGINEVVYLSDLNYNTESCKFSREMLNSSGVVHRRISLRRWCDISTM